LVAPTVKDQRYITPGLACARGLYLGDPSAGSTIEVVAKELGAEPAVGDRHAKQGSQVNLSHTSCLPVTVLVRRLAESHTDPLRHSRRQEGPVRVIIIAAIIAIAIVALLFVVNARLNRRSPELEDYPRKPDGADDAWWTGGGPGS
jgi:hypothetical protein